MRLYVLIDPRTGEIRYVGVTARSLEQRLADHLSDSRVSHKSRWVKKLKAEGLLPEIRMIHEVPNEGWQDAEIYWISYFKSIGCPLTNMTEGGEGSLGRRTPHSEATRAKMSAAHMGHKVSEKTRAKMRVSATGVFHTEASKLKISTSKTGTKMSDAARKNISEGHKGLRATEETREKLRAARAKIREDRAENGGFPEDARANAVTAQRARREREANQGLKETRTEEARARMSAAQLQACQSPENKANRSAGQKTAWVERRARMEAKKIAETEARLAWLEMDEQ